MPDSPIDWALLQHAYGSAGNIPALLKAAETAPAPARYDQDPWFSLWSSLCHQEDVYPASYAALPELVSIAESRDGSERAECLFLAGCIELERHNDRAPALPVWLIERYRDAIAAGVEICRASLASEGNQDDRRKMEIAFASFMGDFPAARHLLGDDVEAEA